MEESAFDVVNAMVFEPTFWYIALGVATGEVLGHSVLTSVDLLWNWVFQTKKS